MSPKIGVVLSGCGVFDGAEIHESVVAMLALDRAGAEMICMAPNVLQMHVVDHLAGQPVEGESRNVLVESARIARGEIVDMATVKAADLDGLVFPGGFGAAKNLCDFAIKGADCTVNPEVERLVKEMFEAKKAICALCIAPAMIAAIFRGTGVGPKLTIGTDEGTAAALQSMGANHCACAVAEVAVDEEHKIVTGPAYMLAGRISEVADSIEAAIAKFLELV